MREPLYNRTSKRRSDGAGVMGKLRILALDGGYRPLVMCLMLQKLEAARPGLLDLVDVFAGTSSGSATAALIGVADTPQRGLAEAISIFRRWNPLEGTSPFSPRTLGAAGGFNAFLTHQFLYDELLAALGETRLKEVPRKLVIPTVELDNHVRLAKLRRWSIQVYHNLAAELAPADRLVDVVLRSSSIPLLQPAYQGHVDGGLFANNPSDNAVIAVHDFLDVAMDDMVVLSIGQSQTNHFMDL
ncbi:MAG: patatin-like phospholipase family protein, partial [Pseudomonadota bacterium]